MRPANTAGAWGPRRLSRRTKLRRLGVPAVLLGLGALCYGVLFTSLLGVRAVEVVGARGLDQDVLRTVAAVEPGKPMLRLDTDAIAARVSTLPRVCTVEVRRSWPGTVELVVNERDPVAVMNRPDGVHLIDATSMDYAVVKKAPPGLPVIELPKVEPGDPTTTAVVSVLGAIPAQLRAAVVSVTAESPGSVRLTLADGRVVRWGSVRDSERKAAVLGVLMTVPGRTYDVASPDLPTVS